MAYYIRIQKTNGEDVGLNIIINFDGDFDRINIKIQKENPPLPMNCIFREVLEKNR